MPRPRVRYVSPPIRCPIKSPNKALCDLRCADGLFASASLDGAIVLWSKHTLNPVRRLHWQPSYKDEQKHMFLYPVQHMVAVNDVRARRARPSPRARTSDSIVLGERRCSGTCSLRLDRALASLTFKPVRAASLAQAPPCGLRLISALPCLVHLGECIVQCSHAHFSTVHDVILLYYE